MLECKLCPFECGVNRDVQIGRCGSKNTMKIARADLHFWEEPCICGSRGSGTVFFSGCNLHCVYCQNKKISDGDYGYEITVEELTKIFFALKKKGAVNINIVTGAHFLLSIIEAIKKARILGLSIPIVYNTSSYEKKEMIKKLDGIVDIYLPDLKYINPVLSKKYSMAENYFQIASEAIAEMVRQKPRLIFSDDGMLKSGVIVRHLVLPGCINNSKKILKYLHEEYNDKIILSIMNQYTPCNQNLEFKELKRRLKKSEYQEVLSYAEALGIKNIYTQEGGAVSESFIPEFSNEKSI